MRKLHENETIQKGDVFNCPSLGINRFHEIKSTDANGTSNFGRVVSDMDAGGDISASFVHLRSNWMTTIFFNPAMFSMNPMVPCGSS